MKKLIHILLFGLFLFFAGCQKELTNQQTTTLSASQKRLDSVIFGDKNLKFFYDSSGRVIKERFVNGDTVRMENAYSYQGNATSPYMKTHTNLISLIDHISYFQYNSQGNKVYDSTVYLNNPTQATANGYWYIIVNIDYSVNGRIAVVQEVIPQYIRYSDTLFVNSNGNTDSIRHYMDNYWLSPPPFSLVYGSTSKFSQFNSIPNYFKSLSISKSKFYQPEYAVNPARFLNNYETWDFQMAFDYFNTNYFTVTNSGQKQIQFDSDNLPVSHVVVPDSYQNPPVRYVFK